MLDSPLTELRRRFPNAEEDTVRLEETAIPALDFHIGHITATALLDAKGIVTATNWYVSGTGGVLPGGIPMSSNWGELRRRYGEVAVEAGELGVFVEFCSLPGLMLGLDEETMPETTYRGLWDNPSPDSVPNSARIDRITIVRSSPPPEECR